MKAVACRRILTLHFAVVDDAGFTISNDRPRGRWLPEPNSWSALRCLAIAQ